MLGVNIFDLNILPMFCENTFWMLFRYFRRTNTNTEKFFFFTCKTLYSNVIHL